MAKEVSMVNKKEVREMVILWSVYSLPLPYGGTSVRLTGLEVMI
jgi:hypothetical protein